MEFLRKLFGNRPKSSAEEARGRLISVLIHDRTDIAPQLLENLRMEMIVLLKKYMDIDESNIEINLDHGSRAVALVAHVPVMRVKRGTVEFPETGSWEEGRPERAEPPRNPSRNKRRR